MRYARVLVCILVSSLFCALAATAHADQATAEDGSRPVDVIADGAWSWYMDPRVLTDDSATYIGSVSSAGDIQVTRVGHVNATLTHTVLHPALDADDHAAPSLLTTPDGRLAAFYSGHNRGPVRYRVATTPRSISSFAAERRLTGSGLENADATYTQIMYLRGESRPYYLITRIGGSQTYHLTTSKDLVTWSPAIQIIGDPNPDDPINHPYAKFANTDWRTIHIAVSEGLRTPTNSLFHVVLRNGVFYRSDGTAIRSLQEVATQKRPIMPAEGTMIYDGNGPSGKVRVYDLALTPAGVPTVAVNTTAPGNYAYQWIQRQGSTWARSRLLRTSAYPAGITLDHADPSRVFLIADHTGQTEVEQWTTPDSGQTWASTPVTAGSAQPHRTPTTPHRNPTPRAQALWLQGEYTTWWDFHTGIQMLTDGPAPVTVSHVRGGSWSAGATLWTTVFRGRGGTGAEGATVIAKVTLPGQTATEVDRAMTDSRGKAPLRLPPLPSRAKVQVVVIAKGGWGYAATKTVTVP